MSNITLAEYFPQERKPFRPKTYMDWLPTDLHWYLNKYFLSDVDKMCLQMSRMEEGRVVTQQELDDAAEAEQNHRMETGYWDNYDPFDRWDYEYGEADFEAEWSEEDDEWYDEDSLV